MFLRIREGSEGDPVAVGGLDGVEDPLYGEAVRERGFGVAAGDDRVDEVVDLVGERVLVAETVPGGPPGRTRTSWWD